MTVEEGEVHVEGLRGKGSGGNGEKKTTMVDMEPSCQL